GVRHHDADQPIGRVDRHVLELDGYRRGLRTIYLENAVEPDRAASRDGGAVEVRGDGAGIGTDELDGHGNAHVAARSTLEALVEVAREGRVVDRHGDTDFVAGIPGSQAASGDLEAEDEDVRRGQIEVTELDDVACQQDAGVFDLAGVIVDVPRHRERATEHGA